MRDIGYRVRTELARYLAGEISLGEFVELFLPLSWTTSAGEEHAVGDLLHEIDLPLEIAPKRRRHDDEGILVLLLNLELEVFEIRLHAFRYLYLHGPILRQVV